MMVNFQEGFESLIRIREIDVNARLQRYEDNPFITANLREVLKKCAFKDVLNPFETHVLAQLEERSVRGLRTYLRRRKGYLKGFLVLTAACNPDTDYFLRRLIAERRDDLDFNVRVNSTQNQSGFFPTPKLSVNERVAIRRSQRNLPIDIGTRVRIPLVFLEIKFPQLP